MEMIQIKDWDGFCTAVLRGAYKSWVAYIGKQSSVPAPEDSSDEDLQSVMPIERVEELAFDKSLRVGDKRNIINGHFS